MSYFTNLKTSFKNLLHLENALNKLEITYKRERKIIEGNNSKLYNINLVIPQSNNYDITFNWNGEEYELVLLLDEEPELFPPRKDSPFSSNEIENE